jgi:hypothetical protein
MSFDNDNMIGTIPPGFLAPADGNYAPNGAQGASPAVAVVSDARRASDESDLDAEATVGARHAVPVLSAAVDLGPNNTRCVNWCANIARKVSSPAAMRSAGFARPASTAKRAQVVRLIGERAQQLVPSAAKRALNDWTQTTLAAHRGKNARSDAATVRRELAPASPAPGNPQAHDGRHKEPARSTRSNERPASKGRVDYHKLSDDQILDL